jgi:phosphohistidine phosphatase
MANETPPRRLLLLRHAKTERAEPGERDHDRKLTERGRTDAPVMGAYIAQHRFVPDLVLVSPATRTRETWALVAGTFSSTPRVQFDARIYNATSDALAGMVREINDARTLMLIGHNPGLHDLALQLIGSGDVDACESLNEKLPTSGLVVIRFALDDWALLHDGDGRLERFVSPRELETS